MTVQKAHALILFACLLGNVEAKTPLLSGCSAIDRFDAYPYFFMQSKTGNRLFSYTSFETGYKNLPLVGNYLQRFATILKSQGTNLIFVGIPATSLVYPDEVEWDKIPLKELDNFDTGTKNYLNTTQMLRQYGIGAIDVLTLARNFEKGDPVNHFFFEQDHHWTVYGAQATAKAVADFIKDKYPADYGEIEKGDFVLTTSEGDKFTGGYQDIIQKLCHVILPQQDQKIRLNLSRVDQAGLLGDENFNLVLIGDSYSDDVLGFPQSLSNDTGLAVLNASVTAGGAYTSMYNYFTSRNADTDRPKFLIWQSLFAPQESSFYRQIIPLMYDKNVKRNIIFSQEFDQASQVNISVPQSNAPHGSKGYVKIIIPDVSVTNFDMKFTYADGLVENLSVDRGDRIKNDGNFYYEFSDEKSTPVKVSIDLKNKKTAGSISIVRIGP